MSRSWQGTAFGRRIQARWTRFWRGEYETTTLRSVPSWGVSILFHLFLLLVLALLIQIGQIRQRPEQAIQSTTIDTQLGDVTSLTEAIRSGDPFTKEDTLDPPSLGLDPGDTPLKLVGQPEIASLSRFASTMASPIPLSNTVQKASLSAAVRLPDLSASVAAPFSGRQGLTRAKLVRREGGTARSEKSVEDGIAWIVRHQRPDGSWSLNFQEQCQQDAPCPAVAATQSDTAATGLALLPLFGAGCIHTVKSKYQDSVRRGLEWLVEHQEPDGNLYTGPGGLGHIYSHGIGTMAICEAYGLSQDPKLKQPARRAIQYVVNCQDPVGGGWRYFPGQPGDTSVFGWQLFGLRSGYLAGIKPPQKVLKAASRYLDQAAADQQRVTYAYQPGRGATNVMTAEGLVSRQLLGWPRDFPALVKGAALVAADLRNPEERNIYYWYYATQLLHNMKNKDWEEWNLKVREGLINTQMTGQGCAQGSWDPFFPETDHWGRSGGRLFQTALSILTLEVYYRYLPLYRDFDNQNKKDEETAPAMKVDDAAK
jgi:Squalene-hopene cyclase C-terminal domain/Prenyltransferase and squalene oxidase repeat